jgi:hypothetical protein
MTFTFNDILAGPIVRRIEPGLASVWVALRKKAKVTLRIWNGLVRGDTDQMELASATVNTLSIGAELHLALVTVDLSQGNNAVSLQSDRLYSYDIVLQEPGSSSSSGQGLLALGLLQERKTGETITHLPLGYEPGLLPGFVLPPTDIQHLKILQGSCRLPHSAVEDAMPYLDAFFERDGVKHYLDPLQRPHQLFLTGDQIYADEVAVDYLALINPVGNRLLSGNDQVIERLPFIHNEQVHAIPTSLACFPPSRRQRLIRKAAKLTSGYGDSHLLGFGEYCAMYLLAWSNVLWPADFFQKALDARWQRVQAYITEIKSLRQQLKDARKNLKETPYEIAEAKLEYFPAWRLLPPEWRKLDKALELSDRREEWGTEDIGNLSFKEPPDSTVDITDSMIPGLPNTAVKRALAQTLSPSWFVGVRQLGFGDSDGDDFYQDKMLLQLRSLQNYYEGLPKVRRVLANVATYMTFDDHETTDDWNITQNWIKDVNSTPLGRTVLRNGLLTYGLFQAWGNDPLYFSLPAPENTQPTPGNLMLQKASQLFLDQQGNLRETGPQGGVASVDADSGVAAELNRLFNLGKTETPRDERIRWNYRIGGPGYEVISLDTRTFRGFKTPKGPPELITVPEIKNQIPPEPEFSYGRPADGKGITFVIAAAPVLGFPPVDFIGQPILNTLDRFSEEPIGIDDAPAGVFRKAELDFFAGALDHDPEPWSYHEDIFEELLARLASYERVIFLSGDVHYACSVKLDYWRYPASQDGNGSANPNGNAVAPKHTRFIQLTSSAFKNFIGETANILSHSGSLSRITQTLALPQERMVWDKAGRDVPIIPPAGKEFNLLVKKRLQQNLALIPVAALPEGTKQQYNPSRVWRLNPVQDGRGDGQRYQGIEDIVPAFKPLLTEGEFNIDFVDGVVRRHFWHSVHGTSRNVTFLSNVGQIAVKSEENSLSVVYAVHHKLRELPMETGRKARPYTTYEIALTDEGSQPPVLPSIQS